MVIDLYQLEPNPPCRAVVMVAQHLGIKLNPKRVDIFTGEHLKPEFLKMNPEHCVPTIVDDGFILWESRAIMKYFVNKYAPESSLYPKDPQQRAVVDRMLYFDLLMYNTFVPVMKSRYRFGSEVSSEIYDACHTQSDITLQVFEDILAKHPYAAGNHITLADYSIISIFPMAELVDIRLEKYPKIVAYIKRLKQEIPNFKEINDDVIEKSLEHHEKRKGQK